MKLIWNRSRSTCKSENNKIGTLQKQWKSTGGRAQCSGSGLRLLWPNLGALLGMCINKHASCRSGQKKRCPQSTWCSLCSINAGYSYFLAMHCVEGNLPAWSMWHNKLVSSKECEPTARWLKIIWKISYESKFNCTSFVTTLTCKWAILSWFCCLQFAFLHS